MTHQAPLATLRGIVVAHEVLISGLIDRAIRLVAMVAWPCLGFGEIIEAEAGVVFRHNYSKS